jgi:hypothetical protein
VVSLTQMIDDCGFPVEIYSHSKTEENACTRIPFLSFVLIRVSFYSFFVCALAKKLRWFYSFVFSHYRSWPPRVDHSREESNFAVFKSLRVCQGYSHH